MKMKSQNSMRQAMGGAEYEREDLLGVRVRFAPSPTGPMHAGNVRVAVFNWLFARRSKGKFILRIDDTDEERNKPEHAEEIMESLKWLGLDWDEGPFYQSRREEKYMTMLEQLASNGRIYPCFCTEEKLELERKASARAGRPPIYSGNCGNMSDGERNTMARSTPSYALRFKVEGANMKYFDVIRGDVEVNLKLVGDFVIFRSNGRPTYNFTSAVDDGTMNITHVIRGEDHIDNTPKQMLLLDALGFRRPICAHLPLIVAEDGSKLGKRDGRFAFADIKAGGYMPEAVLNFLALIGWSSEDKKEEMTTEELTQKFTLGRIARRQAQYDLKKLDWFNARKIKKAAPERLLQLSGDFIKKQEKHFGKLPEEKKILLMESVKYNIGLLNRMDVELAPFFEFSIEADVKNTMKEYPALDVVNAYMEKCGMDDFAKMLEELSEKSGAKGKNLYMPLRAALTGRLDGPELKSFYDFLSPQERLNRAEKFVEFLKK